MRKGQRMIYKPDEFKGQPQQVPAIVCKDFEKLTMDKFISCDCSNNLSALTISGNPTDAELFEAWTVVISCYKDLINSEDAAETIQLSANIQRAKLKINTINGLCDVLQLCYTQKLCECLQLWGYNLPFTRSSYLSDIETVRALIGNEMITIESLRKEYFEGQRIRRGAGQVTTKKDYIKVLRDMAKRTGKPYAADSITVKEYGHLYNQYLKLN